MLRAHLSKHPEIERCYSAGLINRRALARHLIKKGIADQRQMEALIAALRRFPFKEQKEQKDLFKGTRINIKDAILILDFEKEKDLLQRLQKIVAHTDYDKGDTLKIVVGSASIKLFIDQKKEDALKNIMGEFTVQYRMRNISEFSILFPSSTIKSRGIISAITRELSMHDIPVLELLTASPELLIYVSEEHVIKTYEILKSLQ